VAHYTKKDSRSGKTILTSPKKKWWGGGGPLIVSTIISCRKERAFGANRPGIEGVVDINESNGSKGKSFHVFRG